MFTEAFTRFLLLIFPLPKIYETLLVMLRKNLHPLSLGFLNPVSSHASSQVSTHVRKCRGGGGGGPGTESQVEFYCLDCRSIEKKTDDSFFVSLETRDGYNENDSLIIIIILITITTQSLSGFYEFSPKETDTKTSQHKK